MRNLIVTMVVCACGTPAIGGLVSVSTSAEASAEFDGGPPDTATSTMNADSIGAFQSANNSFTEADLSYGFDSGTDTFSGTALIVAEKTVSARPGGDHCGTADYSFTFTTDETMDFTLAGTWGFDNITATGTADSLSFLLEDSSGMAISSGSTTSGSGIASDTFSDSGTLAAGTYTFTISGKLFETLNNMTTAQAGWDLQQFTLSSSTVGTPEPSSLSLLITAFLGCLGHRRRRSPAY